MRCCFLIRRKKKYPENDGQVKLLYVAATRALHELAVLYTGELTGILAKEAPKAVTIRNLPWRR